MTHRSQMSLTSVMATLRFCLSGNNGRHPTLPLLPPPTKLSAFLTVGQKQKKTQQLSHFIHLCQADSNSCNMRLPLKATQNHMCESPAPSDAHTHRQPGVTGAGQLRGSQNQRYKSWKLKDLQMGHLSLALSLRQECFSLNSRLNVNQEPQMQIRVGVCCSKPLWAKQAKKKGSNPLCYTVSESYCNRMCCGFKSASLFMHSKDELHGNEINY